MNLPQSFLRKKNMKKKASNFSKIKVARTRRQRGYHWEDTIVKRFNAIENWKAFRLGSPSVGLPDVLAVSTDENTIYAIEAKSGTVSSLTVPYDQIERCLKWTKVFDIYEKKRVILAFKFLSKKRIGTGIYESRELREFYKIWDPQIPPITCICTYDGEMYSLVNGVRQTINLANCSMPFKSKNVKIGTM